MPLLVLTAEEKALAVDGYIEVVGASGLWPELGEEGLLLEDSR